MTEDVLIGKQLGEYRLETFLAQGGMARVYIAVDVRLNRNVVVKVIDPALHTDPDYIVRFEREAQAIARLDHPNIVKLYRFDEQDGWLYMAMQYVQGVDLGNVLAGYRADNEFIEPEDARRIIGEICAALDYAHQKGIIHRDVKPANILLDRQGRAFLTDFGLALVTDIGTRGEIFGSPHYIAPEQAMSSAKAVPQSDLYAIGVILFEMFTGIVPFDAPQPLDIALLHMGEPPPAPRELRSEINPELEAVILKALSKDQKDRYPTGAALAEALDQSLKARSALTLVRPPSSTPRHTIPERVAQNLGEPALPPIPAVVAVPTPEPVEEVPPVKSNIAPTRKQARMFADIALGIGLLLLAFVCLAALTIPSLINRFNQNGVIPTNQQMTSTLLASSLASAESLSTALILQPEATLASAPVFTETPSSYQILIIRSSDGNSMFIVNQSQQDFPLSQLQLKAGKITFVGTTWGVDVLASGACVGLWKEKEGFNKPSEINCQLVGAKLEQKKKDFFGSNTIEISFDGQQLRKCDKKDGQCLVSITP